MAVIPTIICIWHQFYDWSLIDVSGLFYIEVCEYTDNNSDPVMTRFYLASSFRRNNRRCVFLSAAGISLMTRLNRRKTVLLSVYVRKDVSLHLCWFLHVSLRPFLPLSLVAFTHAFKRSPFTFTCRPWSSFTEGEDREDS